MSHIKAGRKMHVLHSPWFILTAHHRAIGRIVPDSGFSLRKKRKLKPAPNIQASGRCPQNLFLSFLNLTTDRQGHQVRDH